MKKQKTTSGLFLIGDSEKRKSDDKSEMRKIAKEQTIKYSGVDYGMIEFKIKLFLQLMAIVNCQTCKDRHQRYC